MHWFELLCLAEVNHRSTYLKWITSAWGVEVKTIVEIGVYDGTNASCLRNLFPEAHLYLVDPWHLYEEYAVKGAPISLESQAYEDAYQAVCKRFKNDPKTTILRMNSVQAALTVPDGLDLVFIDGNHEYRYVKEDIQAWSTKVRPGGIISGHDYHVEHTEKFNGVRKAVDEVFSDRVVIGQNNVWVYSKVLA